MTSAGNTLTTIYIARHGETEFNKLKILQGHVDSDLTEKGRTQAKELGKKLENIHFDEVFSSDLGRAKKTAELATLERELVVKTTALLRERCYGEYDGRLIKDYEEGTRTLLEKARSMSEEERMKLKFSKAIESDFEISERMLLFLREIGAAYIGKTILVVSHGSIMRMLLIKLGWAQRDELPGGSIENSGYVKLETDGVDFFVRETAGITKAFIS